MGSIRILARCTAIALAMFFTETAMPDTTYPPVNPKDRLVGVAYTTWHQSVNWTGVWGTPELGFYRSNDRAVIRKHGEWLANAGVDFIWPIRVCTGLSPVRE